ncbi:hypothetical protein HK105_203989 [Polyrhizophydium stewartii]|uniref:RRM domain-containing protein n=1 Tax=Polyrhizophydium stewartii TaxID=2732419 RepID=A0ABR4NAK2_9FUNG
MDEDDDLGRRTAELLSDDALAYDLPLLLAVQDPDGIDILKDILPRLGDTGGDEALVAFAVRKNCAETLEVSEDGRRLRRRTPVDASWIAQLDARMVYVDCLGERQSFNDLAEKFDKFGAVAKVVAPRSSRTLNVRGSAFVVFADPSSAEEAVKELGSTWRPLTSQTNVAAFVAAEIASPSGPRVLSKCEWNRRTMEFLELLKVRFAQISQAKAQRLAHREHLSFMPGVVARFSNRLFGMISPVSNVAYANNETSGYVQFKTAHGALLAETFFNRERVVQTWSKCSGKLMKTIPELSKPTVAHVQSAITLNILRGREENEYWRRITKTFKSATVDAAAEQLDASDAARDPGEASQSLEDTKHIRFDLVSDDDGEGGDDSTLRPGSDNEHAAAEGHGDESDGEGAKAGPRRRLRRRRRPRRKGDQNDGSTGDKEGKVEDDDAHEDRGKVADDREPGDAVGDQTSSAIAQHSPDKTSSLKRKRSQDAKESGATTPTEPVDSDSPSVAADASTPEAQTKRRRRSRRPQRPTSPHDDEGNEA